MERERIDEIKKSVVKHTEEGEDPIVALLAILNEMIFERADDIHNYNMLSSKYMILSHTYHMNTLALIKSTDFDEE